MALRSKAAGANGYSPPLFVRSLDMKAGLVSELLPSRRRQVKPDDVGQGVAAVGQQHD